VEGLRKALIQQKLNLFMVNKESEKLNQKGRAEFYTVVAKLLYQGKRARPNILLAVQFFCTRVQSPTKDDKRKLERVVGYLMMTKNKARVFDRSTFERVTTYIDASSATHEDGKSQSGCFVMLGNTLVHEACQKQKIVTKNSTEAELVALSDYYQEGELVEDFLFELGSMMKEDLVTNVHLVLQIMVRFTKFIVEITL
jgi:hypothetical protein